MICINELLQGYLEILFTCSVLYMTEDKSAVLFCKLSGNYVPDEGEVGYVVFWYVRGEIKGIPLENLFVDFVNTGDIVMCYPATDCFGHSAGDEVFPAKGIKLDHNRCHQRLTGRLSTTISTSYPLPFACRNSVKSMGRRVSILTSSMGTARDRTRVGPILM